MESDLALRVAYEPFPALCRRSGEIVSTNLSLTAFLSRLLIVFRRGSSGTRSLRENGPHAKQQHPHDLKARLANRARLTTDGHGAYLSAIACLHDPREFLPERDKIGDRASFEG